MEFLIEREVPIILIKNIFGEKTMSGIFKEALDNENFFKPATTGNNLIGIYRNNVVLFLDQVYSNKRNQSLFLTKLDEFFCSSKIRSVLASSWFPLTEFFSTTRHETQISRYGNSAQKYKWHIDRFENNERLISFVYYFGLKEKKYSGGEIAFSTSPIFDGELIEKSPKIVKFQPENDMGVFFSSNLAHSVLPTNSPEEFKSGRFSANVWIGK